MKLPIIHFFILSFVGWSVVLLAQFDGFEYSSASSMTPVRLEQRQDFGGRIVRGQQVVSTLGGTVNCGEVIITSPWDTTIIPDGWLVLVQNDTTVDVAVLNDSSVVCEEGRLAEDTTWDDSVIHLIRNDLYIPNGITLSIIDGTVVKFTEDTHIVVESGGKLDVQGGVKNVTFALATDDLAGGDTDMRETTSAESNPEVVTGYGTFSDNGKFCCRNCRVSSLPNLSIASACQTFEHTGIVRIPVTIGDGSRSTAFSVDWIAVPGTAMLDTDYLKASGTLEWSSTSQGTSFIEIPLRRDDVLETPETFTVYLTVSYGANVLSHCCKVTIFESSFWGDGEYLMAQASSSEVRVNALTNYENRMIGNGTVDITYSPRWVQNTKSHSVSVTAEVCESQEYIPLLVNEQEEGVINWETSMLDNGRYDLSHETFDESGKLLEKLSVELYVNRDIELHKGILGTDETWQSGTVHVVSDAMTVPSGITLTIEDGSIVKFIDGTSINVESGGFLQASGVIFTHFADDSAGGDSNLDGNASQPSSGKYTLGGQGTMSLDETCELRYVITVLPSGNLAADTILTGNRVYQVKASLTIPSGMTLTIMPGAVLKFNSGTSLTVASGGTLNAIGNRAQPIVFTSYRDDAHGGDSDGDGGMNGPQPGDWQRIYAGGNVNMNYVTISYLNNSSDNGAIQGTGGTVVFDNSAIEYSVYECVRMNSGSFTAHNSVFREASMGFGYYGGSGVNCYNCVIADVSEGSRSSNKHFHNCIFYRILDFNGSSSTFSHCLFYNPSGYGEQSFSQVGIDGNLWGDPLFTDPDNGDFTLRAGSPCIDAGDGSVAPETDYYGQPRQDIREMADTGTAAANGAVPDIGLHEALPKNAASTVDFLAVSCEASGDAVEIGNELSVSWSIRNIGSESSVGSWRDYIYLVDELGSETLLGVQTENTAIAPNGLKNCRGSFEIPDVEEGAYHIRVKCNLNREVFEGTLTENNVVTSDGTVNLSYPKEEAKVGFHGEIPAGESEVRLLEIDDEYSLAAIHAPQGTTVYYSLCEIPTEESYISKVVCKDGETWLNLPAGEVYVWIVSPENETCDYSVDFRLDEFAIQSVVPNDLPGSGMSLLRVHGSRIAQNTEAFLVSGEEQIPVSGSVPGDNDMLLTVQADALTPGTYDLMLQYEDEQTVLPEAITVEDSAGTVDFWYDVVLPETARVGRKFTVTVNYGNQGTVAMPAPIFRFSGNGRTFIVDGTEYDGEVELYCLGAEWPYGYLQPGVTQTVSFQMMLDTNSAEPLATRVFHTGIPEENTTTMRLTELYDSDFLATMHRDEPEKYQQLLDTVGNTYAEYYTNLAEMFNEYLDLPGDLILSYGDVKSFYAERRLKNLNAENGSVSTRSSEDSLDKSKGQCMLEEGSRLGKVNGLCRDQYSDNVIFSNESYNFTAPPIRKYNEEKRCFYDNKVVNDFNGDISHPGQIWWYHKGCKNWHTLGFGNDQWEKVCNEVRKNKDGNCYLICHGNECSIYESWLQVMADKIIAKDDKANVFAVDWGDVSMIGKVGLYPEKTAPYIPKVADETVRQIGYLCNELGLMDINKLTIIGHSHGAHLGGTIAARLQWNDRNVKRLVGLDSSPMWSHSWYGKYYYPDSWDSTVAKQVEFYKTSWRFSMGEVIDEDVYGTPSFFVVNRQNNFSTVPGEDYSIDHFERDLYAPLTLKFSDEYKGSLWLDGALSSLSRHGFSHDWFISTIDDNNSFGNFGDAQNAWKKQAFTNRSVLPEKTFCGVLCCEGKTTRMELGRDCVEKINSELTSSSKEWKITENDWRYDHLVLDRAEDNSLGISTTEALARLWFIWSMLVEYRAANIQVLPNSLSASIPADSMVNISFDIYNYADNLSVKEPRDEAKNVWDDDDTRNPDGHVPWSWTRSNQQASISNQVWIYDLSSLSDDEREQILEQRQSDPWGWDDTTMQQLINKCPSFLLHSFSGKENFVEACCAKTLTTKSPIKFSPCFDGRNWPLGYLNQKDAKGQYIPYGKGGEPFLIVGKTAQINDEDTPYPGDLYYGDNNVMTVVYVTPSEGALQAYFEEVANNVRNTRSGDDEELRQQTEFKVTAAEDGSWNITFSAEKSICENGLKYYHWETKDFSPASGDSQEPYLAACGKLEDNEEFGSYSLSLTVYDQKDLSDKVEVTIMVQRGQSCHCKNKTHAECACHAEDCTCGAKENYPRTLQSCDPNEMAGMTGYGDSATQRFVKPGEEMTYTVYFENKSDATAAAQEVRVTSELSSLLDWTSFQMVEVGFNNQIDNGLAGKSRGTSETALADTDYKIRTELEMNQKTGRMTCYMRIVDDTTADGWPVSAYDGFLPPNDDTHCGEGYIKYRIAVREDAPANSRIDASATIVFDYNEAITTSPAWFNWVSDGGVAETATGLLTWDAMEGATYDLSIWKGDADNNSEKAEVVADYAGLTTSYMRIPAELQDGVTHFWQVITTDASGNKTSSAVWSFELGGRLSRKLQSGWNLVTVPFVPNSFSRANVLSRNPYTLDGENASMVQANNVEVGHAYWIHSPEDDGQYLDIFPESTTRTEISMTLTQGWNFIGPTENDYYLDGTHLVWEYGEKGFQRVEPDPDEGYTLKAGSGYWVFVK